MSSPHASVDLSNGVRFELWPLGVSTVYPDGCVSVGTRDDTEENRREALDQGYDGSDAVHRSLVEHELLHTLLTREVFGRESHVLRHESGAETARYAIRLHEEALVISAQRWANTGEADKVLSGHTMAVGVAVAKMRDALCTLSRLA